MKCLPWTKPTVQSPLSAQPGIASFVCLTRPKSCKPQNLPAIALLAFNPALEGFHVAFHPGSPLSTSSTLVIPCGLYIRGLWKFPGIQGQLSGSPGHTSNEPRRHQHPCLATEGGIQSPSLGNRGKRLPARKVYLRTTGLWCPSVQSRD